MNTIGSERSHFTSTIVLPGLGSDSRCTALVLEKAIDFSRGYGLHVKKIEFTRGALYIEGEYETSKMDEQAMAQASTSLAKDLRGVYRTWEEWARKAVAS